MTSGRMNDQPTAPILASACAGELEASQPIVAPVAGRDRLALLRSIFAWLALFAALVPLWPGSEALGAPLVLAAVICSWPELRRVARVVLVLVCVSALAALLWAPHMLVGAAVTTARLTAVVIAVMLLSSTLGKSRDLGALSASLLSGRSLPRYLSLSAATGFLAMPLNFGSVGVMGAMVGRVMQRSGDTGLTRNAARAVLRGFGLASLASPLSISLAITLSFLPNVTAPATDRDHLAVRRLLPAAWRGFPRDRTDNGGNCGQFRTPVRSASGAARMAALQRLYRCDLQRCVSALRFR